MADKNIAVFLSDPDVFEPVPAWLDRLNDIADYDGDGGDGDDGE